MHRSLTFLRFRQLIPKLSILRLIDTNSLSTTAITASSTSKLIDRFNIFKQNSTAVPTIDDDTMVDEEVTADGDTTDIDAIRARGFLRYHYKYTPPIDLENHIKSAITLCYKSDKNNHSIASALQLQTDDAWKSIDLDKYRTLKFKLLYILNDRLHHGVPNSRLHEMHTVSDVISFYSEPVNNVHDYALMARSNDTPKNMHLIERVDRFHPDDTDQWHAGITATPGLGGKVAGLRFKRLYRQYKPKKEWYDFDNPNYSYEPIDDTTMPWSRKMVEKMDRNVAGRYDIRTRSFRKN